MEIESRYWFARQGAINNSINQFCIVYIVYVFMISLYSREADGIKIYLCIPINLIHKYALIHSIPQMKRSNPFA